MDPLSVSGGVSFNVKCVETRSSMKGITLTIKMTDDRENKPENCDPQDQEGDQQ